MTLSIKDIYETIRGLQIEDRKVEELEALLIHEDDYIQLLKSIQENRYDILTIQKNSDPYYGEIEICGMKVIKTSHIQPGSIFKIFKKDKPYKYPSGFEMWQSEYPMTIPESGSLSLPIPTIMDNKEKEEKKKHSLARKIELD